MFGDSDWSGEERDARIMRFQEDRTNARMPRRPAASSNRQRPSAGYRQPQQKPQAKPMLQLRKGDMVRHTAFGSGMVLSVQPMGGDALLEIAFDNVGTKKLMLKAASQFMTKL